MLDETLKMLIVAFNDGEYNIPAPIPPFKAHVNPESYTKSVSVHFSSLDAPCRTASETRYSGTSPQRLQFDFLLDRTGALGNIPTGPVGVTPDIEHFKRLALEYDGNIHSPRFLMLIWGTLLFRCRLKKLDIEHKMFSPQGLPLRAVIKATFIEHVDKKKQNAIDNLSSPDLTHARTVKDGDTLPLMTHRIYGDSRYYLEVARVNGITNFRNLQPGSEIVFPPIEKMN